MPAFLVAVLLYLFPKEVVAKFIVILFKKLASMTEWTQVDDDMAKAMEETIFGGS